jgi:hypothetical protein
MNRRIGIIGGRLPAGAWDLIGHLLFSLLRFLAFWFAIIVGRRPQIGREKRGMKCHAY